MLDAEMNQRYWSKLGRKYSLFDTYAKIFLAILSSGCVAGWQFWGNNPEYWKTLSGSAAILSVVLPILKWPKVISQMSDLSGKWVQIKTDYELLWIDFDTDSVSSRKSSEINKRYKAIKQREVSPKKIEFDLPKSEKLLIEAYKEVVQLRS